MEKLSDRDDAWLKRQISEVEKRGWSEKRAKRLGRRLRDRLTKAGVAPEPERVVSLVNQFELFPCHACKELFNRSKLKAIAFGRGYCIECSDRDFGGHDGNQV